MRETYGDLHHGKYNVPLAHYVDVNYGPQDFDDDWSDPDLGEWAGVIGKRILVQDGQGFVSLYRFSSAEEAREVFESHTAGWYEDEEEELEEITDDPQFPEGIAVTTDQYRGVVFRVSHVEGDDVIAYMVGDDRHHRFSRDDVTVYREAVCSCGQIGCSWGDA